ncbi:MAG: tetratricopeptide repeat protein [Muribaculaceae bacterium]|nr:tetratricopeptide repeat protein [Muribaculaceae bacterium]
MSAETERLTAQINTAATDAERASLYYKRGRAFWQAGDKAAAISDYEHAAALDPQSEAATALELARDVMNFYHRERFNP